MKIGGNKQDMTDSSSLTTEIETAIEELLKEYHEKYGTSNQEKTFEEFIKEKWKKLYIAEKSIKIVFRHFIA